MDFPWLSSALSSARLICIFLVPLQLSQQEPCLSPQVPSFMLLTHLVKCWFEAVAYFGKCPWGAAEMFNSLSSP